MVAMEVLLSIEEAASSTKQMLNVDLRMRLITKKLNMNKMMRRKNLKLNKEFLLSSRYCKLTLTKSLRTLTSRVFLNWYILFQPL